MPVEKRNWTTYNYAALWISMAHCIPTYMMASGLISAGMNWWQALITILLGNIIVLAPILLNSHPGTKYGIPFPVFARASYGTTGSNLPALMRAIVACGWFGIQAWIGGQAIHTFFAAIIPNWQTLLGGAIGGHTPTEWLSFLIFWAMNIFIIYRGMDLLQARRKLGCAVCFNYDGGFARVDFVSGGRRWISIERTRKVSNGGRVLEDFYSQPDGDDWLLGDAFV
ncbi:MAG: cytosine permease [Pyrinomonadaceae bacterium]